MTTDESRTTRRTTHSIIQCLVPKQITEVDDIIVELLNSGLEILNFTF